MGLSSNPLIDLNILGAPECCRRDRHVRYAFTQDGHVQDRQLSLRNR